MFRTFKIADGGCRAGPLFLLLPRLLQHNLNLHGPLLGGLLLVAAGHGSSGDWCGLLTSQWIESLVVSHLHINHSGRLELSRWRARYGGPAGGLHSADCSGAIMARIAAVTKDNQSSLARPGVSHSDFILLVANQWTNICTELKNNKDKYAFLFTVFRECLSTPFLN